MGASLYSDLVQTTTKTITNRDFKKNRENVVVNGSFCSFSPLIHRSKGQVNDPKIMTMKKKKYNARFPPARIKKIMQTDEDVGKVAQPVPVIISRALELFVENLLKKANDITSQRGARTLTPSHLKMCIKSEKRFDFLQELVSSVPDVQGDHDGETTPGANPAGAVGLDFTMSTLTSAASGNQENTKNTSKIGPGRPNKYPRQLSTPRPRGRPRTVSLDSESKIPKKRKKKRQHKYVDDDFSGSDEAS